MSRQIFGSAIPTVRFTSLVEGTQLRVRFEQKGDSSSTFRSPSRSSYTDGTSQDVIVKFNEATTERMIPLKGTLRAVEVNKDNGALAEIEK